MKYVLTFVFLMIFVAQGFAQSNDSSVPNNPEELKTFLHSFVKKQMEEFHVPGMVFVLVKDGKVFYAEGFGFANVEKQTAMIPDRTVFRAGSVSKLITATAVMQLYERGKIDLHKDVNTYLTQFKLPNNYPQPVTVADLLRHTGGFDEIFVGMHARTPEKLLPLGEYLGMRMSPRTIAPGQLIAYSDYGMSLAGLVVELVSGESFAQYIQHAVFQPLTMDSTTFRQPLPDHMKSEIATGYSYRNGKYIPYALDYVNVVPAAGLHTTAMDMAKFMIAHLQNGCYEGNCILQAETVQEMHKQQFTHHPLMRGRAYGFSEWIQNGQRAIFHDGGMPGFMSRFFLLPDHNMGFFIACNGDHFYGVGRLLHGITTRMLDHYFPLKEKPVLPVPPKDFAKRANEFTGYYRELPFSHKTIEKIVTFFDQVHVTKTNKNTLAAFSSQMVEVEPLVFNWDDGIGYVTFRKNEKGAVTHMLVSTSAFEKLAWYDSKPAHIIYFIIFFLISLWALISGIKYKDAFALPEHKKAPGIFIALTGALNVVFLICMPLAFHFIDRWSFLYGLPWIFYLILTLPIISAVLMINSLRFLITALFSRQWSGKNLVSYSFMILSFVLFLYWLISWNLLGYQIHS